MLCVTSVEAFLKNFHELFIILHKFVNFLFSFCSLDTLGQSIYEQSFMHLWHPPLYCLLSAFNIFSFNFLSLFLFYIFLYLWFNFIKNYLNNQYIRASWRWFSKLSKIMLYSSVNYSECWSWSPSINLPFVPLGQWILSLSKYEIQSSTLFSAESNLLYVSYF